MIQNETPDGKIALTLLNILIRVLAAKAEPISQIWRENSENSWLCKGSWERSLKLEARVHGKRAFETEAKCLEMRFWLLDSSWMEMSVASE